MARCEVGVEAGKKEGEVMSEERMVEEEFVMRSVEGDWMSWSRPRGPNEGRMTSASWVDDGVDVMRPRHRAVDPPPASAHSLLVTSCC